MLLACNQNPCFTINFTTQLWPHELIRSGHGNVVFGSFCLVYCNVYVQPINLLYIWKLSDRILHILSAWVQYFRYGAGFVAILSCSCYCSCSCSCNIHININILWCLHAHNLVRPPVTTLCGPTLAPPSSPVQPFTFLPGRGIIRVYVIGFGFVKKILSLGTHSAVVRDSLETLVDWLSDGGLENGCWIRWRIQESGFLAIRNNS